MSQSRLSVLLALFLLCLYLDWSSFGSVMASQPVNDQNGGSGYDGTYNNTQVDGAHFTSHGMTKLGSRVKRGIELIQFSEKEKSLLIKLHNEMRRKPKAADMTEVTWDPDLEEESRTWSRGCYFWYPAGVRRLDKYSRRLAHNIYYSETKPDIKEAVQTWYDQIKDYTYGPYSEEDSCKEGKQCRHYTQLVWAKTRSIGCYTSLCEPFLFRESRTIPSAHFVVCVYGPGGNFPDEYPYTTGKECSMCPDDEKLNKCNYGLCSNIAASDPDNSQPPLHFFQPTLIIVITTFNLVAMVTCQGHLV